MHPSAILRNPVILGKTVILSNPVILGITVILSECEGSFLLKILGSISETYVVFKLEGSIIGKSCSKGS